MTADGALEFPSLRVRVDAARAAEFARETGFDASFDGAPSCYPAVWLTTPTIHGAIALLATLNGAPVGKFETLLRLVPRAALRRDAVA